VVFLPLIIKTERKCLMGHKHSWEHAWYNEHGFAVKCKECDAKGIITDMSHKDKNLPTTGPLRKGAYYKVITHKGQTDDGDLILVDWSELKDN